MRFFDQSWAATRSRRAATPGLRAGLLAVALLLGAAKPSGAADRQLLAVLKFDVDKTVSDSAREALEESLRNLASERAPGYTVLDGKTQLQILEDNGIDPAKACAGSCAMDVARQLSAKVFLSGSLRRPDRLYRAFVRTYLSSDGTVLGSIQITGGSIDELLGQVEAQSDRLFGRLGPQRPPGEDKPPVLGERDGPHGEGPRRDGKGFLTVLSQPRAQVLLDGDPAGQTPLRRRQVDAGAHLVVLAAEGYAARSRQVDVPEGRELTVSEALAHEEGAIDVDVSPSSALVLIDGRKARPGLNSALAVGQHTVRAEAPAYSPFERTVVVDNGGVTRVPIALAPAPGKLIVMVNVAATCSVSGAGAAREARPDRPAIFPAEAGEHAVTCEQDGFQGFAARVSVPAARTVPVEARLVRMNGGETRVDARTGITWVHVPGGKVRTGCLPGDTTCFADEKVSSVEQVGEVWLARTETTVAQWLRCVETGGCADKGAVRDTQGKNCNWKNQRLEHPVNCINASEAEAFCAWASGRLPTGLELEYVAKGGDEGRRYPWGAQEPDGTQANYCDVNCTSRLSPSMREQWEKNRWIDRDHDDHAEATARVGSYPLGASRWGLLDVAGNVWEWTSTDAPGGGREVRGGGWVSIRAQLRGSARQKNAADYNDDGTGVRCARSDAPAH